MRHYYRFMELEPVMEQEEDSVGEASPTSSMGSPSFSPPPDDWTQIPSKDFHDPLTSHLLQEHLDLQRAYRLLEIQLKNCDTRASRDLQKMKEVLPAQERLREELQRAKEREASLKGEIYDLHEQNELLEFRILELEECQENATGRTGQPDAGSRDVATDTGDVTDANETSLPTTTTTEERIQERLGEPPANDVESETHGVEPRLAPDKPPEATGGTDKLDQEQPPCEDQGYIEESLDTHSSECTPHPRREEISCTLCRRLPRRRSVPEPSQPPPNAEDNQKEALRKSKSDGEIIARKSVDADLQERGDSTKKLKDLANVKKLDGGEGVGKVHRCVGTHLSVKEEGVQAELGGSPKTPFFTGRVEDQVRTVRGMLTSIYQILQETRVEVECTNSELREEVQTLESTLQRLKEEAVRGSGGGDAPSYPPPVRRSRSLSFSKDCYCCSQDLQPALEEVISKLHQVMDVLNDSDEVTALHLNKPEVKKCKELPNYETRHILSTNIEIPDIQVGEIIVKYDSKENRNKEKTVDNATESNSVQMSQSENVLGDPANLPSWNGGIQKPIQTKDKLTPPPRKKKAQNGIIPAKQIVNETIKSKMYKDEDKPEPQKEEYDSIRRNFESQSQLISKEDEVKSKISDFVINKCVDVPPLNGLTGVEFANKIREYEGCMVKGTDEAIKHLEELAPLPEEKTKPVLRRWREQLLVRRDRVQPWRIEMLDFPKRLPSVV